MDSLMDQTCIAVDSEGILYVSDCYNQSCSSVH